MLFLHPIYLADSRNPFEFPQIVGDDDHAQAAGVAWDVQIVDADGRSLSLQGGADDAVLPGGPVVVGEHVETADKVFHHGQVSSRVGAFFHSVRKLRKDYGRDGHATLVLVEGFKYRQGDDS